MYDDLIRELELCPDAEYGCSRCEHRVSLHCRESLMKQAADAIAELSKPKWISVEERLPEDLRDVQITVFWHDAWRTMYGFYDGKFWHLYAPMHTEVADVEVVGWMEKPLPMPLPEPPEGNE